MAITAKQVKELREMTGAGMMDCKKALGQTDGDMVLLRLLKSLVVSLQKVSLQLMFQKTERQLLS